MPGLHPHLTFPLTHTRRSGKLALALAALLVVIALASDASAGRLIGAHDWRQRVVVVLPGVCAQPQYLPAHPDLPSLPLAPAPDHWPDWPGWLTCGGEHATQHARARALGVFGSAYASTANLAGILNQALQSSDGDTGQNLPVHIEAIEAFSYSGARPTYDSSQTRQPIAISAQALNAQFLRWLQEYPAATFDLIGHSLGGAVATYWAASVATPAELQAVHSIITLDSPLGGYPRNVADRLFLPFFSPVANDLLEGSPIASAIAGAPGRWSDGPGTLASPIVTITNIRDYVVPFPWATIPNVVLVADDYGTDSSSLNHGAVLSAPAALAQIAQIIAQQGMPILSAGA